MVSQHRLDHPDVGAVFQLVLSKAVAQKHAPQPAGRGNVEQGFANARYGGGNGRGLTYNVHAKSFTRGLQYHFSGDNFDDWRGLQTGFRTDWARTSRDLFTIQGDAYGQEAGQRMALGNYTPASQVTISKNAEASARNLLARRR